MFHVERELWQFGQLVTEQSTYILYTMQMFIYSFERNSTVEATQLSVKHPIVDGQSKIDIQLMWLNRLEYLFVENHLYSRMDDLSFESCGQSKNIEICNNIAATIVSY